MAGDEGSMQTGLARTDEGPSQTGDAPDLQGLIAAGDHKGAIEASARAYAAPLGRLCMAFTGSQAESEELVQETLLAAYDALPQYRGEGSVRAWLFGIARRICGRHVETRDRREARLRLVSDPGVVRDAGELALDHERANQARAALAKLKPTEREAVVLRYEAGLSFREVAIACGVDEAVVRKRVSRALSRLREDLGKE